ncbi:hypothetical protein GCM10009504_11530 [Pseudomonas laurentiana]|uniref:Uncharacterized protein n=1 Tax=Pseudomonas laurentiana TaxID=2364649 RepID=A0A6I5RQM5_9PSED|nr:hypothetical protein [Pseudomonas laurentiana]NES09981.1 hypothetical protein [Pseudomonas laurentiana]GGU56344.1 hypothetical protein GCM10009504_11530 [Pseudomonas laurentiana]
MSLSQLPHKPNRQDLRKALVRLQMEMHRQEIRQESSQLLAPLTRLKTMTGNLQNGLGIKHAPLWGLGAIVALGFLTGKGARSGNLARLIRLGSSLVPLVKVFMQNSSGKP